MSQERKDPGEAGPVTPGGAHGEQFYAILRAGGKEKKKGYTVRTSNYVATITRK